ncbi:hypothetical protein FRC0191_01878 [Corynebacterium diphtheriae]|uniref:hypothetical protein n=1 Tax=Corynebacterium diphtheriae TaxID=1717 RepID=UPI0013CBF8B4|nr:hypothetical protein [Corynebacterium diphtheriae]MBG9306405.1 hypothetical protein [Corynebacterium diphtheriae bv. mitis]CAB0663431.1 hypothetical protein CIP107577_01960 [Corynebacterium diphtheriae]CAB0812095.1 hypothetical protein FRC0191_01878 [Corynebacterium diphtheriae]
MTVTSRLNAPNRPWTGATLTTERTKGRIIITATDSHGTYYRLQLRPNQALQLANDIADALEGAQP